jgi:hypothetical protein
MRQIATTLLTFLAVLGIVAAPASGAEARSGVAPAQDVTTSAAGPVENAPWAIGPTAGGLGQIVNNNSGQCAVMQGYYDGAEAIAYSYCDSRPAYALNDQLWKLDPVGNGWYWLRNFNSDKCLIAPSWNGRNLIQYTCMDFADQHWTFSYGSPRTMLRLRDPGQCLTGPSWAPGDLVLYPCEGHGDQYWNFRTQADAEVENEVYFGMEWMKIQFRRGSDCRVQYRYLMRDLTWSYWWNPDELACTKHRVTAAMTVNRTVQFFRRGVTDVVYTNWLGQAMYIPHGWVYLGGVTWSPVEVGRNADGRLHVFVRGTDGRIHTKWQPGAGLYGYWSEWRAFQSASYPDGGYARSDPFVFES